MRAMAGVMGRRDKWDERLEKVDVLRAWMLKLCWYECMQGWMVLV